MARDRLKDVLVAYLLDRPAVAAITGDRISPYGAHQGETYPRVTYYRQMTDRGRTLSGGSDGLPRAFVQLDCWALQDFQAVALAKAVRDSLDGFRGRWGDVAVQAAFVMDESDLEEQPSFGGDNRVYRVTVDAEVWYEEAAVLGPGVSAGGEVVVGAGRGYWGRYFG